MTPEELMKPRYKVIDIWPGMHLEPFGLGQIVTLQHHIEKGTEGEEDAEGFIYVPNKHIPRSFMWQSFFDTYKNLFKKLEWWEDRKIEDMPEYIKIQRFYELIPAAIYEVGKEVSWLTAEDNVIGMSHIAGGGTMPNYIFPATREEYEQYKQKEVNNDRSE